MTKQTKEAEPAQGAEQRKKVLPVAQLEQMIEVDLKSVSNFIACLMEDKDLRHQMAVYIHGRLVNIENQKALEKQPKLPLE